MTVCIDLTPLVFTNQILANLKMYRKSEMTEIGKIPKKTQQITAVKRKECIFLIYCGLSVFKVSFASLIELVN